MPLYVYVCKECGHRFEEIRRLDDSHQMLGCPQCRSTRVEKQPTAASFKLKGRGFHCNDYPSR